MQHKHAKTIVPINKLIAQRWSSRAFHPQKQVSTEQRLALFEAARWAPSCYGDQPWYLLALDRFENEAAWQKALDCIYPGNRQWAKDAPLILIITAKTTLSLTGEHNHWAEYDTGAAAENLVLQATDMGLMSRQIGGFMPEKAQSCFEIPETFRILTFISIGYPDKPDKLTEDHMTAEMEERKRNELTQHFFVSSWGNSVDTKD
jgi:nitroreductase